MSDDATPGSSATPPWAERPPAPEGTPGDDTTLPSPPPSPPPPTGPPAPGAPPPGSVWAPPPGAPPITGTGPPASADLAPPPPPGSVWGAAPGSTGYGPPRRLSSGLSISVQVLFWISAALSALTGLGFVLAAFRIGAFIDAYEQFNQGLPNFVQLDEAIDDFNAALGLSGIGLLFAVFAWIGLGIVMIIWTYQAHKLTDSFNPGQRSWGTGWSIGAWFVPFANYVLPKLVLNEIERIGVSPRTDRYVDANWRDARVASVGWAWWFLWIGAGILVFVSTILMSPGGEFDPFEDYHLYDATSDLGNIRNGYFVLALVFGMYALSLVCGALYVRHLARALTRPATAPDGTWPAGPTAPGPWGQGAPGPGATGQGAPGQDPWAQAPLPQGPPPAGPTAPGWQVPPNR